MPRKDNLVLAVGLGGEYHPGNLASIPEGKTPKCLNLVTRPGNEVHVRERYTNGGPPEPHLFGGLVSEIQWSGRRGVAFFETNTDLSETVKIWARLADPVTGVPFWQSVSIDDGVQLVTDAVSYQNLLVYNTSRNVIEESSGPSSIDAVKFGGANLEVVKNVLKGGIELSGRYVAVFGRRLVMANAQRTITNLIGKTFDAAAMFGISPPWEADGVTVGFSGQFDETTLINASATTGKAIYELSDIAVLKRGQSDYFVRSDLYGEDPVDEIPMTVSAFISGPWILRGFNYATIGMVRVMAASDGERYIYALKTAGVTSGVEPVFSPVKDADTTDGTAVWRNVGPDVIASEEVVIPAATDARDVWTTVAIVASFAPVTGDENTLGLRLQFGTSTATTWPTTPVRIGHKDGLATADSLKRNYGQQVTLGQISAPFVQSDTDYSAVQADTSDTFWWTEVDSFEVMSLNFQKLSESPGEITGIRAVAGRMVIFKRNMTAIFQLVADEDLPFVRERTLHGYGAMNQHAIDVIDDTLYTISVGEVYRFDGSGMPEPLCGEAMREEIFSSTDDRVSPAAVRLGIDREKREVHVHTRRNIVFVLNLETMEWSRRTICGSEASGAARVTSLIWANNMLYTVCDSGVLLRGETGDLDPDEDGSNELHEIPVEYWMPQITGPGGMSVLIEAMRMDFRTMVADTPFSFDVSRDGGDLWNIALSGSHHPSTGKMSDYVTIPVWVGGEQIWVRMRSLCQGGRDAFRIVGVKAFIQILGEAIPVRNAEFV